MAIPYNFSDPNTQVSISKGPTHLQANTIHEVHIKSAIPVDIDTKNGKMKILSIVFENSEGLIHDDRIFEPRSQERKPGKNGALNPSEYDSFMTKIRLYARVFAPKLFALMNDGKMPVTSSWDQLITMLAKSFEEGIKAKTVFKIKLLKNGDFSTIPRFFLKFNKNNELFISTKFISAIDEPLEFSDYELNRIKEEQALKPTKMQDFIPTKDDVMDMSTGVVPAPSQESTSPFGGGQSDDLERLMASMGS